MEDRQNLLLSIDGLNDDETSWYAQDMNQVSGYCYDARGMVKLYKSNYLVDFAPLMNHCHGW